jgi:hypothetical protein
MYRRYLNARSPLRLLEKGLHGGLGRGNLGLVLAARGVGKTSFLVGVAMDDLLRGEPVLHVSLDHTVSHVRDYYDTVFEALAKTSHLEDVATVHAEVDRLRRIRAYPAADFDARRLGQALELEGQIGGKIALVVVDGFAPGARRPDEIEAIRDLARDKEVELWFSATLPDERVENLPASLSAVEDFFSVVLTLEPHAQEVALRALKDHDSSDVSALHVGLDPRTLLLVRS